MRFKVFLEEMQENNANYIVYQKMLMALDSAHISKKDNSFEYNLGAVVKDSSLSNLIVKIKTGNSTSVKLGVTHKNKYVIEITVDELPDRMEIDTLLSSNKSLMNKFLKCLEYYKSNNKNNSNFELTKQEKIEKYYDRENIEKAYENLVSEIENKLKEYKVARDELMRERDLTLNIAKKHTIEAALKKLKSEYIGDTETEFIKKVKKLPSAEFLAHLDKNANKTIIKRLESFYEQTIKQTIKQI